MVPYKTLCGGGRGVTDKRSETGPGGENVAATDFDVWGEVATDFFEDPSGEEQDVSSSQ